MERDDRSSESGLELKTAFGTARYTGKRMSELIAILSLVSLVMVGMALWKHSAEASANSETLRQAFRDMTIVQEKMLEAQREQNCLIALPQDRRDINVCRRIVR